jgi:hypothetical protein
MALPLNVFKTVTHVVTTTNETIYTAPAGYSAIVLMAQITNVSSVTASVTFSTFDGTNEIELLKGFEIPANDAASGTTGKLVLETGNSVKIQASANDRLKITLSVLESSNG